MSSWPGDYPISYYSCFQIMLLTDPEVESSLLISLDEGATYQKYGLAFDILSLLFHPEQEDWILAYSHEQKVNVSRPRRKYLRMRQVPFFFPTGFTSGGGEKN